MSISAVLKTTCGAQMIRIFLSISIQLENTFKFIVNIRSKLKEKEEPFFVTQGDNKVVTSYGNRNEMCSSKWNHIYKL